MEPLDRVEDERLVLALRDGDQDAFGRLFDRWYDRVHDLARRITRDDGLAADVAQDAFLAAWQRLDGLDDPAAFGGWLLRIARNRALDVVRAPAHARTEADEDVSLVADEQAVGSRLAGLEDPALVAGDREVQELVWSAAVTLGERDLTALDLSLRQGLDPAEIGEVLGINRNAANQLVHRMRGRLATAVRSRVLWRGGRPECAALREVLANDGLDRFDAQAVRVTDRHAGDCTACTRRRETRLDPAHLFAAVPITAAPVLLKAEAAAALEAAGAPMGGPTVPGGAATSSRRRHPRRRRALTYGAVAVIVVTTVVAVLGVERLDRGDAISAEGPLVTATAGPSPTVPPSTDGGMTVVVNPTQPAADGEPASGLPDEVTPPASPDPAPDGPAPPPPPPAPPTASLAVSPGSVGPTHPRVTVSWSTGGGTTVSVSGPGGVASSAASGSQSVCPNGGSASFCQSSPGTYTYVLSVTGPGGTTERTATLTVS